MNIHKISLENVGQLKSADVEFGDLTVLVGQQATGKTVFLEILKLIADKGHIHSQLTKHGFDWKGNRDLFLDTYLGEGMRSIWSDQSQLKINGKSASLDDFIRRLSRSKNSLPASAVL